METGLVYNNATQSVVRRPISSISVARESLLGVQILPPKGSHHFRAGPRNLPFETSGAFPSMLQCKHRRGSCYKCLPGGHWAPQCVGSQVAQPSFTGHRYRGMWRKGVSEQSQGVQFGGGGATSFTFQVIDGFLQLGHGPFGKLGSGLSLGV